MIAFWPQSYTLFLFTEHNSSKNIFARLAEYFVAKSFYGFKNSF